MTSKVFRRIQRLEVAAKTVTSMNSTSHTLLWVGMDRQPVGGIRWDRDQKRYVDVDLSTLRWDAKKRSGQTIEALRGTMTSRVFRRLERLELRNAAARGIKPIPIRVLLVDPERGLTGVLLLDGANPTTLVIATAEEEASVREDLARRQRPI